MTPPPPPLLSWGETLPDRPPPPFWPPLGGPRPRSAGGRSAIGAELKEFGLSTSQYATLMMAEAQPGMSVADVAREVASSRQAANEMIGGLEQQGLIERHPNPSDRRTHRIQVTESGRTLLARARIAVGRREAELEAALAPEQREAVRDWLDGISEACR
ncbi:MarR family winged helix-turn-helix transcriptional regulator [Streptomyces sp. NPDC058240]|uniref:MarR family winged helix-turn-helix transcriptional regulator n=1 Tax=Streptomyces sp. NPDC058240 TaxID=3346396 RepID=UPI0036EF53E0